MADTEATRITRDDVEREARWLVEAGHACPASLLMALWDELDSFRREKPRQVHEAPAVDDGEDG